MVDNVLTEGEKFYTVLSAQLAQLFAYKKQTLVNFAAKTCHVYDFCAVEFKAK